MAITYHIDKISKIVCLEGEHPDIEVWKQTLLTIFADLDYEPGFNFLSDRRFSDKTRSADYLRAALNFLNVHADKMGKCKWATVVSSTAAYGMGRMVQILSEEMHIKVEVFTSVDEARHWLTGGMSLPPE